MKKLIFILISFNLNLAYADNNSSQANEQAVTQPTLYSDAKLTNQQKSDKALTLRNSKRNLINLLRQSNNILKEQHNKIQDINQKADTKENITINTDIDYINKKVRTTTMHFNADNNELTAELIEIIDITKKLMQKHNMLSEIDKYSDISFSFYDLYTQFVQQAYNKKSQLYKIMKHKMHLTEYYANTFLAITAKNKLYLDKLSVISNSIKTVKQIVNIINTVEISAETKTEILNDLEDLYKTATNNMIKLDRKYMKHINQVGSLMYKSDQIHPDAYEQTPDSMFSNKKIILEKYLLKDYLLSGAANTKKFNAINYCNMIHMKSSMRDTLPADYIYRQATTLKELKLNKKLIATCTNTFGKHINFIKNNIDRLVKIRDKNFNDMNNSYDIARNDYVQQRRREFQEKSVLEKLISVLIKTIDFITPILKPPKKSVERLAIELKQKFADEYLKSSDKYRDFLTNVEQYDIIDYLNTVSFKSFFALQINKSLISGNIIRHQAILRGISAAKALSEAINDNLDINHITKVDIAEQYQINKPIDDILEKTPLLQAINNDKIVNSELEDYDFATKIAEQSKDLSIPEQYNLWINHIDTFNKLRAKAIKSITKSAVDSLMESKNEIPFASSLNKTIKRVCWTPQPVINQYSQEVMQVKLNYATCNSLNTDFRIYEVLLKYGLGFIEETTHSLITDPASEQQNLIDKLNKTKDQIINANQLIQNSPRASYKYQESKGEISNKDYAEILRIKESYKNNLLNYLNKQGLEEHKIKSIIQNLYSKKFKD